MIIITALDVDTVYLFHSVRNLLYEQRCGGQISRGTTSLIYLYFLYQYSDYTSTYPNILGISHLINLITPLIWLYNWMHKDQQALPRLPWDGLSL